LHARKSKHSATGVDTPKFLIWKKKRIIGAHFTLISFSLPENDFLALHLLKIAPEEQKCR
jgi:hypothetical protein